MSNCKPSYFKLVLLIVLIGLFSCSKDDAGVQKNTWLSVAVRNLDNAMETPRFAEKLDSIPCGSYGIAVDLQDTSIVIQKGGSVEYGSASFTKNPLVTIAITSLQDFDESHPEGSLLNNYFKVRPGLRRATLQLSNAKDIAAANFGSYNDLLLYTKPSKNNTFQFIVKLTLSNGNVLADTTQPVFIYQ